MSCCARGEDRQGGQESDVPSLASVGDETGRPRKTAPYLPRGQAVPFSSEVKGEVGR
jgi:hypothetical protein